MPILNQLLALIATLPKVTARSNTVPTPYRPAPAIKKEAAPTKNDEATSSPQEVGVYLMQNGRLTDVLPEIVNWQTGGVLKSTATLFIVKGDKNGKVLGSKSRTQASCPLEFLIKTLEGTSVEEYQLLRLHKKSNRREFRSVTGGVLHVSGGAQRDDSQPVQRRRGCPSEYSSWPGSESKNIS